MENPESPERHQELCGGDRVKDSRTKREKKKQKNTYVCSFSCFTVSLMSGCND